MGRGESTSAPAIDRLEHAKSDLLSLTFSIFFVVFLDLVSEGAGGGLTEYHPLRGIPGAPLAISRGSPPSLGGFGFGFAGGGFSIGAGEMSGHLFLSLRAVFWAVLCEGLCGV